MFNFVCRQLKTSNIASYLITLQKTLNKWTGAKVAQLIEIELQKISWHTASFHVGPATQFLLRCRKSASGGQCWGSPDPDLQVGGSGSGQKSSVGEGGGANSSLQSYVCSLSVDSRLVQLHHHTSSSLLSLCLSSWGEVQRGDSRNQSRSVNSRVLFLPVLWSRSNLDRLRFMRPAPKKIILL